MINNKAPLIVLFLVVLGLLAFTPATATCDIIDSWSLASSGTFSTSVYRDFGFKFSNITKYDYIYYIEYTRTGTNKAIGVYDVSEGNYLSNGESHAFTSTIDGEVVGTGTVTYSVNGTTGYETILYEFDSWDRLGKTGSRYMYFTDAYPRHLAGSGTYRYDGTLGPGFFDIGANPKINGKCHFYLKYCEGEQPVFISVDGAVDPSAPTSFDPVTPYQTSTVDGYHYGWLTYFVDGEPWPDTYHFYGWDHTNTTLKYWDPLTLPVGDYQFFSGFSVDDDGTVDAYDYTNFSVTAGGSPLAINILEKYSNAALVNQPVTVTLQSSGSNETKTSVYGETIYFGVVPYGVYWINASRSGYLDYNETYTVPATPGIYTVYMERTLTPIANHSYAHFSVVDQTNGGLIPNAEIRLSDGQTKQTNSAGYAWFSVNNSEQINYYVSKPSGYWPAYGAMNLTADESILVALKRYTGPTATATIPGWTPVTVPTTGTGVNPVVTLSAQLRQQNVQEGMDVWYTNLPFISQFLFLLFIIGGLGLMAGGTRRN